MVLFRASFTDGSRGVFHAKSASAVQITIDIAPYKRNNIINLRKSSLIDVVVITTNDFDALEIDPNTVEFGPDGANNHGKVHVEDIDLDGDMDLLLRFRIPETGIVCGDTEATLVGQTGDGTHIIGTDSIKTVACR